MVFTANRHRTRAPKALTRCLYSSSLHPWNDFVDYPTPGRELLIHGESQHASVSLADKSSHHCSASASSKQGLFHVLAADTARRVMSRTHAMCLTEETAMRTYAFTSSQGSGETMTRQSKL